MNSTQLALGSQLREIPLFASGSVTTIPRRLACCLGLAFSLLGACPASAQIDHPTVITPPSGDPSPRVSTDSEAFLVSEISAVAEPRGCDLSLLNDRFLEYLPDAQCGDPQARLHLLALGADVDFEHVPDNLRDAATYRLRGWSIVPQLPGRKSPCVKWKPYQERLPTVEELFIWWTQWLRAGIALVLGRISRVLAVDVDGEDAHRALIARLGGMPKAPRSLSGSGKSCRYHLFFRHPPFATSSKYCPWHDHLEFRGDRGIIVLPPSLHKSGRRYEWARGESIFELDLPDVPEPILNALAAKAAGRKRCHPQHLGAPVRSNEPLIRRAPYLAWVTQQFLRGEYAEGPDWNARVFRAACDLAGNGVNEQDATPALLAGAKPWNEQERVNALRTIASAYSIERVPVRELTRLVDLRASTRETRRIDISSHTAENARKDCHHG